MILPPATIGIVGGGQLARMMILEGRKMGYRFWIVDPDPNCCAACVSDHHIIGSWSDQEALMTLAKASEVVTVDTEHVPWALIDRVTPFTKTHPNAQTMKCIQDRLVQRQFLEKHGLPQTKYRDVTSVDDINAAHLAWGFPLVLKTRTDGYDGKGQIMIKHEAAIAQAWRSMQDQPCVVEAFVDFQAEVSVLLARSKQDDQINTKTYPLARNEHQDHILHQTFVPSGFPKAIEEMCFEIATQVSHALDDAGMLAVEMFVTRSGDVLINEIAPRPHNSGHFTYGGCVTSQFEQHIRAITGQPLADPSLIKPCGMLNLVGDKIDTSLIKKVMMLPNATLHLYDKTPPKPGRKMGHVLMCGPLDKDINQVMSDLTRFLHEEK